MTLEPKSARFLYKSMRGYKRDAEPFLEDLQDTINQTGKFIEKKYGVDALKDVIDFVGVSGPDRKPPSKKKTSLEPERKSSGN